jgi:hypothetical protein
VTEHRDDQLIVTNSVSDQLGGNAAISQHRDLVGELLHLIEVMADEDEARAL